jgi:protein-tyrosine phosphatase
VTRICFVCLGNICRSPTAEGVMRALAAAAGKPVVVDSAGTGSWHVGELPDPRSVAAAARRGYDLAHRSRVFTIDDLARFDLVLAMDAKNLSNQRGLAGKRPAPRIALLRSFDPTAPSGADVPDPYAGGTAGFEDVLDICERACRGLLETL